MKIALPFACAGIAFAAVSAHAQYKCVADGKTVYQQAPCAGAGQKMEVKPASGDAPAAPEGQRTDWSAVIRSPSGAAVEAPPSRRCPTPQRIRELEFEASKIGSRNNRSLQGAQADARACR